MASRSCRGSSASASDANRSTSVVTESLQSKVDATGKCGAPVGSAAQGTAGVRRGGVGGGQGHRSLGPDRQRPLGVAHTVPVEGQVDDELQRGGAAKRCGRAADDDRTEHRDFDAVVAHAGGTVAAERVGAEGFEPSLGTV